MPSHHLRIFGTLLLALPALGGSAHAQGVYYMPGSSGQAGGYYYAAPRNRLPDSPYWRVQPDWSYPQTGESYGAEPPMYRVEPAAPRTVWRPRRPAPVSTRQVVDNPTKEAPGTIVVDTPKKVLYLVEADGKAVRYRVAVGKRGFMWKGVAEVGLRAQWPGWTPPKDMLRRKPYLPRHMDGGPRNPLGARALYLFRNGHDTLFRIHGTNEPWSIGHNVSSGCIRMLNKDVIDLYQHAPVGTRVVVL